MIILNRLKSLVLVVLGLVKRSLCCFRRRRRVSFDAEPLTNIGVVSNYESKKKYDVSFDFFKGYILQVIVGVLLCCS